MCSENIKAKGIRCSTAVEKILSNTERHQDAEEVWEIMDVLPLALLKQTRALGRSWRSGFRHAHCLCLLSGLVSSAHRQPLHRMSVAAWEAGAEQLSVKQPHFSPVEEERTSGHG